MAIVDLLSFENPIFSAYVFWSGILIVKLMAMSILTGAKRFKKMAFSNPEDLMNNEKLKVKFDDPDVERVRRAHRNDLENILPFIILAFLYVLTDPPEFLAVNLIRVFVLARFMHTYVYTIHILPQPSRAISFMVGFGATFYMAVHVILIAF